MKKILFLVLGLKNMWVYITTNWFHTPNCSECAKNVRSGPWIDIYDLLSVWHRRCAGVPQRKLMTILKYRLKSVSTHMHSKCVCVKQAIFSMVWHHHADSVAFFKAAYLPYLSSFPSQHFPTQADSFSSNYAPAGFACDHLSSDWQMCSRKACWTQMECKPGLKAKVEVEAMAVRGREIGRANGWQDSV